MSHYTQVKTDFDEGNKAELIEAIKEVWPKATILENAKVRGYRGMRQPTADIVVRFKNVESESQGNYDLGFVNQGGKFVQVADFGYLPQETRDPVTGRSGAAAISGLLKPAYTAKVVEKQIKSSPSLRGYRNVSKKNDYIVRKDANGKEVKYKRLVFQEGGYV